MTAQRIDVAGQQLEVLVHDGAGPALVLLHEGLGSVGLWRGFDADLAALTGRRTVVYSRAGHGRSSVPPGPRTADFFEHEALTVLPALIDALELDAPPVLVGHSDGATIALVHAAHHDVPGIVVMAPHVFVEELAVAAIDVTRTAYVEGDLRERMARHHDDVDATFWGWCGLWTDPAFATWEMTADLRRLRSPALLVHGDDDPYGTLEQIDRIARLSPSPTQRLVLPGGHSPHLEHRAVVLHAIRDFAAAVSAP